MRIVSWRQALFGIDRQLMREVINASEFTATIIHGSIIFQAQSAGNTLMNQTIFCPPFFVEFDGSKTKNGGQKISTSPLRIPDGVRQGYGEPAVHRRGLIRKPGGELPARRMFNQNSGGIPISKRRAIAAKKPSTTMARRFADQGYAYRRCSRSKGSSQSLKPYAISASKPAGTLAPGPSG